MDNLVQHKISFLLILKLFPFFENKLNKKKITFLNILFLFMIYENFLYNNRKKILYQCLYFNLERLI